ncbi:cytochrome P460 family protein [Algicella marina]|uniref:Recombinase n=1 Tax=Algicella marina TaxID=2683284 RepID=A0A6P1SVP4_9RHOB|nr:cytochrome P460 family protein [Algicella marina]QHQ33730.1 recombinase [Algicella marina]
MIRSSLTAAIGFTALIFGPTTAHAQDCDVPGADPWEFTEEQVTDLYACMEDAMQQAYSSGDNETASAYRDWTATSTRPAVAGAHGERFLYTFANDVAAEQYLRFAENGVTMPVGSILAKESLKITAKGEVRIGPLFIMTKGDPGTAPETADWVYSGVQPNGQPMKFKQSFCHDCHAAFEGQDALGYPLPEVRVTN